MQRSAIAFQTGTTLKIDDKENEILISQPLSDVIRVQIFKKGAQKTINPFSVLINDLKPLSVNQLSDERFEIDAGCFTMKVSVNPFAVGCYSKSGQLINRDSDLGIQRQENGLSVLKELQPAERFIGLGEKTGPVDRRGWQFTNWNTDAYAYHQEYDPLYSSIPFYIGINGDLPYGVYVNNSCRTDFNFGGSNDRFSFFRSADGSIDYFFIFTGDIKGIISKYLDLTGRPELPPLWALGYHQCRYSYYPQEELILLARTFRSKNIPCDVVYLDIHYMDEYKVFTWNKDRFPNPKALIEELDGLGFKVVIIQDPGIKTEEGYEAFHSGLKEDVYVKYPDGKPYTGEAWPGKCHFPDFTSEKARTWWKKMMKSHIEEGIGGFWNDMNEPAVWGKHFPDFTKFVYEGHNLSHLHAHNVYGMQMVRASHEALKEFRPSKRPFVLTRSAFAGTQRFAWKWTGDNISNDEHLMLGQRLINSLSMSGYFFCGNDVGGFIGECWPELFMRWIAVGAFNPFFRGHSMINSRDHEPWSFGEEAEEVSRNFITLRYKLIPYLYSVFYQAVSADLPVNRPMVFYHFKDERSYSTTYGNQFYLGDSILVCPVLPNQSFGKVWLPDGDYYEMFTDQPMKEGEHIIELHRHRIPVYVKAGSALLSIPSVSHLENLLEYSFQIHLYKGTRPAEGIFYLDEGEGYGYTQGEFALVKWSYIPGDTDEWTFEQIDGKIKVNLNFMDTFLHGYSDSDQVQIQGRKIYAELSKWVWIAPVSTFDPYYKQSDDSTIIQVRKVIK